MNITKRLITLSALTACVLLLFFTTTTTAVALHSETIRDIVLLDTTNTHAQISSIVRYDIPLTSQQDNEAHISPQLSFAALPREQQNKITVSYAEAILLVDPSYTPKNSHVVARANKNHSKQWLNIHDHIVQHNILTTTSTPSTTPVTTHTFAPFTYKLDPTMIPETQRKDNVFHLYVAYNIYVDVHSTGSPLSTFFHPTTTTAILTEYTTAPHIHHTTSTPAHTKIKPNVAQYSANNKPKTIAVLKFDFSSISTSTPAADGHNLTPVDVVKQVVLISLILASAGAVGYFIYNRFCAHTKAYYKIFSALKPSHQQALLTHSARRPAADAVGNSVMDTNNTTQELEMIYEVGSEPVDPATNNSDRSTTSTLTTPLCLSTIPGNTSTSSLMYTKLDDVNGSARQQVYRPIEEVLDELDKNNVNNDDNINNAPQQILQIATPVAAGGHEHLEKLVTAVVRQGMV